MSQKVELTNGGWAILRDPASVSVKLRRPVEKALLVIARSQAKNVLLAPSEVAANIDPSTIDQFYELNDLLIVALVESWSFEKEINLENVLQLSGEDYKTLQEVTAPAINLLLPNFGFSNNPKAQAPLSEQ